MAGKNKSSDLSEMIRSLKNEVKADNLKKQFGGKLPSIIEFVEEERYLGFKYYPQPIDLYPLQRILLKCFYRGSPGNEHIQLTDEEKEFIRKHGLDDSENGGLFDKWDNETIFRELILVWGRRCVSEDAEIVDPKTGIKWKIGDLWNFGKDTITSYTLDESTGKMVEVEGANIKYQGEREVYKVTLSTGHVTEATDNHPFLTKDGWTYLCDLKKGDKVALVPSVPFFGSSDRQMDDCHAFMLGVLCGHHAEIMNGSLCRDGLNEQTSARFSDCMEKAFSSFVNPPVSMAESVCSSHIEEIRTLKECQSIAQLAYFSGLSNKTPSGKHVPVRLMRTPRRHIAEFLKGLFSSDALLKYDTKGSRTSAQIELMSCSYILLRDVQHLLHRFGIIATIKGVRNSEYDYRLTISKLKDVKLFLQEIGFVNYVDESAALEKLLENVSSTPEMSFISIKSIRKIGVKRTFDLEVSHEEERQNFTADGFIVHNSGKDFIVSIIALYEAMRLLESPGGNPYAIYNLGSAAPITILTIANSSTQAKILFREITDKINKSPYFDDKIGKVTEDKIYLLTPADKDANKTYAAKGLAKHPGSVKIEAGHSNSSSLVGNSCFAILFDEIGLYKNTAGSSSGDALYHNLVPATKTYVREEPVLDENGKVVLDANGKPMMNSIIDGKVVCISTPRGKEGIFYELFSKADQVDHRFMMRAPTWVVNPKLNQTLLLKENPDMNEQKFAMEYGAEFSGTAGEAFFNIDDVDKCFDNKTIKNVRHGVPGVTYFAHLDPATSSHNYGLVIVHKEIFVQPDTGQRDFRIVVDHINHWAPQGGQPIIVDEVDDYMIAMNQRFHFGLVTYDHWNSRESIAKLRKHGVPAKMTPFSKQYKQRIYDNLYQLVIGGKLKIPHYQLLAVEMKNLQRKWTESGFKVMPKKDAEIDTDDIVDALAGACFNAMDRDISKLPQGKMVNMPVSPNSNAQVWRSMQGTPYGFGTGQQVTQQIRNRTKSHPNF